MTDLSGGQTLTATTRAQRPHMQHLQRFHTHSVLKKVKQWNLLSELLGWCTSGELWNICFTPFYPPCVTACIFWKLLSINLTLLFYPQTANCLYIQHQGGIPASRRLPEQPPPSPVGGGQGLLTVTNTHQRALSPLHVHRGQPA